MAGRVEDVRSADTESAESVGIPASVIDRGVRTRRDLIRAMLADADQHSAAYVYAYDVGRGAE